MAGQRILSDHGSYSFGKPVEAATHVSRFAGEPDARLLRRIERPQARQTVQLRVSSVVTRTSRSAASKPGSTIRLHPRLNRSSMA